MKESLYCYMKPGLVHFKAYPQVMQGKDYVATLEKICEDDFWSAVEIGPVKDVRERDRTAESVVKQYLEVVRPMHLQFVEPSKRHAHVVIPEGGYNRVAIDLIVTKIRDILAVEENPD